MTGLELITKERTEQIEVHGKTVLGDIEFNDKDQLSKAASILSWNDFSKHELGTVIKDHCPIGWDFHIWDKMMRKPYAERLIISGALIAAELDRINSKL